MEDQKFILLEDNEEPVNNEWNYVIVVPAKDYDTVSKIVENSIEEYRETDRDEYYRGFLRKILLRRGYNNVQILTQKELFSNIYNY